MSDAQPLATSEASLEAVVESFDLGSESLHPGGLQLTAELAVLCHLARGSRVLEVAAGTGETMCFLAEQLGCTVSALDAAPRMLERAREKSAARGLAIDLRQGDAHQLPFPDESFDAVICECTLTALDKPRALGEMRRVLRPGGYAGIHDLSWRDDPPARVQRRLLEIEHESPETLEGWKQRFEQAGFREVLVEDRSPLLRAWIKESAAKLGLARRMQVSLAILRRWGSRGLLRVLRSEHLFRGPFLGYAIVVGRK